ncbi:unnamed protein product [Cochlearia groenlandica]
MPNILFLALQCFECSTMQVKQKKKSSNNWVCVICNQKQSVRKVFAQGYKARELRFFVQNFNMSRKVADEKEQAMADTVSEVEEGEEEGDNVETFRVKKRSDWSEYLDTEDDDRRLTIVEDDGEEDVKIVTEMPKDMFKKPKLNRYASGSVSSSSSGTGHGTRDGNELFKPSFSRRGIKKADLCSDGVLTRKKDTQKRNLEPERVTKPGSRWDAYLVDDVIEHQAPPPPRFCGKEGVKDDDVGEWDRAIMEISLESQIVDDEVHPDFM